MAQIFYYIWGIFSKINGYWRAIILSFTVFVIFILLFRLICKYTLKFYGYLIVPFISRFLYILIIRNKTEKLIKIDDWYYRKLDRLEFRITHKEFYTMNKLYRVVRNVSCVLITLFVLCILYNEKIGFNNDKFDFPHKVTMFYVEIEEKISEKFNLAVPVWNVTKNESSVGSTDSNEVNEKHKVEDEMPSEKIFFKLNDSGYLGANVRIKPNKTKDVLTVVSGNVLLEYMDKQEIDSDGRVWYYIRTPDDIVGWISSSLVEESLND